MSDDGLMPIEDVPVYFEQWISRFEDTLMAIPRQLEAKGEHEKAAFLRAQFEPIIHRMMVRFADVPNELRRRGLVKRL